MTLFLERERARELPALFGNIVAYFSFSAMRLQCHSHQIRSAYTSGEGRGQERKGEETEVGRVVKRHAQTSKWQDVFRVHMGVCMHVGFHTFSGLDPEEKSLKSGATKRS